MDKMQRAASLEEVSEVKGAFKMLRTVEGLPSHVEDQLDEFRQQESRTKEKNYANPTK